MLRDGSLKSLRAINTEPDSRVPYLARWLSARKLDPLVLRVDLTRIACSSAEDHHLSDCVLGYCWKRHADALDDCGLAAEPAEKGGWFDLAIAAYERLLALRPDDAATLDNLTSALLRKWRAAPTAAEKQVLLSQATAAIAKASALDEGLARYNHACVLALSGETQRALQKLRQVLTEDPEMRKQVAEEEDFESLAQDPEFRKLIEAP